jgi:hypothetical protein
MRIAGPTAVRPGRAGTAARSAAVLAAALASLAAPGAARALALRVDCTKVIAPGRSVVVLEAHGVPAGTYRARIISGADQALSDPARAGAGGVRVAFDSDRDDILRGADPIPETFIRGGHVTGQLLDARGAVVAQRETDCPQR